MSEHHLKNRALLTLTGSERLHFLERVITSSIDRLKTAPAMATALLTPQGKVLFDFLLIECGQSVLVDVPASRAVALAKRLKLYKLRADVSIAASKWRVATTAEPVTRDEERSDGDPPLVVADPRHPQLGTRLYGPEVTGEPETDFEARRRSFGIAEVGPDLAPETHQGLEANLDLFEAVDFQKGCFVGQEVVSRMHRKAMVRKRLIPFTAQGPAPEVGTPIHAGTAKLGEIASLWDGGGFAGIRLDRLGEEGVDMQALTAGEATLSLRVPAPLSDAVKSAAGAHVLT
jgi:hypothetical protein